MTPSTMRKGKRTAPALPKTAIGLIVDHAAAAAAVGGYFPACYNTDTWAAQVWRALLLVRALNALRAVSRAWHDVADSHPTWRNLCLMLDPNGLCVRPAPVAAPAMVPSQPPYNAETFRRISRETCIVCAISCPDHSTFRRRSARHPSLPVTPVPSALAGAIYTCAIHRPLAFCARCLRAEPSSLGLLAAPCLALAPLAANERDQDLTRGLDLRGGAGVRAVCGACRHERIRTELVRGRGANMAPWMGSGFWEWEWDNGAGDPGGWAPLWADGSLRQRDAARLLRNEDVVGVVNQYVEYGDWTIREAIEEMEERVWMRWWTKAGEMEGLVRATARMQRMEERAEEIREREAMRARQMQLQEDLRRQVIAAGGNDPGHGMDMIPDELLDEESDEDDDLLSLSDEFGLREMIFQDWARNRILEGIWLSPHMDMAHYYSAASNNPEMRTLPPHVTPYHPLGAPRAPPALPRSFNWTVPVPHEELHSHPSSGRSYSHAPANFYLSTPPPPARLSYHLARAWEGGMRAVIGPALTNIVGRVVKESEAADRLSRALENALQDADWSQARRERAWDRLVMRCVLAHGERDPCRAVSKMSSDQLAEILRGPEAWVEGGGWDDIDLGEVLQGEEDEAMSSSAEGHESLEDAETQETRIEGPGSLRSTSTSSDLDAAGSTNMPSPEALQSPSTMRTTPSPPPSVDGTKRGVSVGVSVTSSVPGVPGTPILGLRAFDIESDSERGEMERAEEREREMQTPQLRAPPILPKLPGCTTSPQLSKYSPPLPKLPVPKHTSPLKPLHPIPLVPTCKYHIGQQTKGVIELLWREATGGLWMCRCGVCARAMSVQGVPHVSVQGQGQQQQQPVNAPQPVVSEEVWEPMEVQIEEVVEGKGKGVAGRRSRERDGDEYGERGAGERKRMRCEVGESEV